jgi:hypothetical protein
MMDRGIWKVALLNWVMLAAAANSNPAQPNWRIAGNYASATACVAAIGQNLATSAITGDIAGWASGALGSNLASGAATAPSTVAPVVCLPADHPWVASVEGPGTGGGQPGGAPGAPPTP